MISRMEESVGGFGWSEIAFETFGVRIRVEASHSGAIDRVRKFLPPGWQPCDRDAVETTFGLRLDPAGDSCVTREGIALVDSQPLEVALDVLERELRTAIALRAPEVIFVHAGAVAHEGRAIVLPGASFAGKTTLVAALVRAGATYYSDEYAVLDRKGNVHPYARPLSVRSGKLAQEAHDVESLGGTAGEAPVPLGAVVVTTYRPAAEWRPERLSPGEATLSLLENTLPAQTRPEESIQAIARSVEGAVLIKSERGEADAVAALLLNLLGPGQAT